MDNNNVHNETEEIHFLEKIGTYCPHQTLSRYELLKAYLKTCNRRVNWHGIWKEKVVDYVIAELEKIEMQ